MRREENVRKFLRRYRWLLGVELACILFCLAACFGPEETVFSAEAEEIAGLLQTQESSASYRSGSLSLRPGAYVLRVVCGDHPGVLEANVLAQESSFQALRSNGGILYPHQREAELELYVMEELETAYVICHSMDEPQPPIESIALRRTGAGWRMALFWTLLSAVGLNLLLWFREGIVSGRVGKDRELVVWLLAASVLVAYLPYALDYFYLGSDGWPQLLRIEGLKETLLRGNQFPVRVQEYWLYGHGYGVSSFCSDLFLLFPALLRMVGFSPMDAYRLFVAAVLTGTALISYHCLYRCSGSRYGALAGSVLYELAPCHICCLYNRSAVEEYMGMMFLPLVAWGVWRLYTEDVKGASYGRAKFPLVVGLGCLLQSHVAGCLAALAVVAATCLLLWKKTLRRETLRELAKAALWCLALNAWFWVHLAQLLWADHYVLTAAAPQSIRQPGLGLAALLQIFPYVGGERTGVYNGEPTQAGAAFWAVALCYVVLRAKRRSSGNAPANPWDGRMSAGLLLGLLCMLPGTRYFLWSALGILFFSFSAAFFAPWLTRESEGWSPGSRRGVTVCCAGCIAAAALLSALFQVNELAWNNQPVRLYTAASMDSAALGQGEYLPQGMESWPEEIGYHEPRAQEGLTWTNFVREGLSMSLDVDNAAGQERWLELPVVGYRGYGVDGEPGAEQPYIARERGAHGDLRVGIPAGYSGRIWVSYQSFPLSRCGELVSWLALAALMGMWLVDAKLSIRRRKEARLGAET